LENQTIGFSKGWKISRKFFQGLEKVGWNFPRLGKFAPKDSKPWKSLSLAWRSSSHQWLKRARTSSGRNWTGTAPSSSTA
jgi:hypothetical protein